MRGLIASLGRGNWKSLLACFLYFDSGFAVWVMWGPLAPFIAKDLSLNAVEAGFLVSVPVLAASVARITLGNLFQAVDGRPLALLGIALSAVPAIVLLSPVAPDYGLLLSLGMFLGMGGASFAIALPMAGSSYPLNLQGLILGLAAAGNLGAVLAGGVFPRIAERLGWRYATAASLPLLALAAVTIHSWAQDRSVKRGNRLRALVGFVVVFIGLTALVLGTNAGLLVSRRTGELLLPVLGALLALAALPRRHRAMLREGDAWIMMLVYSVTFGGFVGMSSYVTLFLTEQYRISKVDAGLLMAAMSFTGAMVRPLGGLVADRLSGVKALLALLLGIATCDIAFALLMPSLAAGTALLFVLYTCLGFGNGATFQLVPLRWKQTTGLMTGIIGAAGGIGGFYLAVVMGIARDGTGSYQVGFAAFGVLSILAFIMVLASGQRWLIWALPEGTGAAHLDSGSRA